MGFGYSGTITGEIVFNTGMVGYVETLTDPSYGGQILTLTYPLVGNYGVPDTSIKDADGVHTNSESERIQARALVVHELSSTASHWNMSMTLDEWMHTQKIPGISGIDTRALTKKLREQGVSMAAVAVSENEIDEQAIIKHLNASSDYSSENLVQTVSTTVDRTYGEGKESVVIVDVGAKNAIIRCVRDLGYKVIVVPWDTPIEKILSYKPSGVVISNGPGDPEKCTQTVQTAKNLVSQNVPTLGICLGAQILGLAGGAKTYKLKYGHRGQNKPCTNLEDGRVYVTSQNHGYCISPESLKDSEFDMWFKNADDGTVEGIRHKTQKCLAVQFHPEASPGPFDCKFVFKELQSLMNGGAHAKE